jgi:hypothetical protein
MYVLLLQKYNTRGAIANELLNLFCKRINPMITWF